MSGVLIAVSIYNNARHNPLSGRGRAEEEQQPSRGLGQLFRFLREKLFVEILLPTSSSWSMANLISLGQINKMFQ